MPKPSTVRVRPLLDSDSVEEITLLLHRAYGRNADQNLRFVAAHQSADVTAKRLSSGLSFVAEVDGELAGVITLRFPIDLPYGDYHPTHPIASFGQFAVEPRFSGQGVGDALLEWVERSALERGGGVLALDTAQPATGLVAYYQARGFQIVGRADWRPTTNYESWILAKRLSDHSGEARS